MKRIDVGRLLELKRMPYPEYLESQEWQRKRRTAIRWAYGKCEQCHSRQSLEVHHRTYERRGEEKMGDLMVLCGECHETEHLRLEIERFQTPEEAVFYGS